MKLSTNLPHQNPEDLFSAEAAPKAKRTDAGPNGTVYDSDGIRRESTREAELRAELAGRKVSHLPTTVAAESDGRTVFSVPEQNGGLQQNGMEPAASSPPLRTEPETIPSQNAAQQHQPNPSPQHQAPPRPLLITQQSATGQSIKI